MTDLTDARLTESGGMRGLQAGSNRVAEDYSVVFTPDSLTGLVNWLDASDASTFTLTGTRVDAWQDKSSAAKHTLAEPSVLTQRPNRTGTINGLDAVRFASSSSQFVYFGLIFATNPTAAEILIAVKRNSAAPSGTDYSGTGLWAVGGSVNAHYPLPTGDSGGKIYDNFANSATRTIVDQGSADLTEPHIYGAWSASGDWGGHLDGVTLGTNSTCTVRFTNLADDGSSNARLMSTGGQFLDADLGEVVMYNRKLTTPERAQVVDYLMTKWVPHLLR